MIYKNITSALSFIFLVLFFGSSHAKTTVLSKLVLGETTLEDTRKTYPNMQYVADYGVENNKPWGKLFTLDGHDTQINNVDTVKFYFTSTGLLYAAEMLFSGRDTKKEVFDALKRKYKTRKIVGDQLDTLYAEFTDRKNMIVFKPEWDLFLKKPNPYKFSVEYLHINSAKAQNILDKESYEQERKKTIAEAL